MQVFTHAERPDLVERISEIGDVWPQFLHYADVTLVHWAKLTEVYPELQLVLYDETRDAVVGIGRTMPTSTRNGYPGGIDDMLIRLFGDAPQEEPDVLSAAVAIVTRDRQGEGLSAHVIEGMRRVAREHGFRALIAPVRPTWKERFPLIAMEEYVCWTREDGMLYDPWLRLHQRLGAELIEVCAESMKVTGTRAEWEEWTGLEFPGDGQYIVEGALMPVKFENGRGVYLEPNVWMRHPV